MKLKAHKTDLQAILPFRNLFLQETNFQIRYNACHERGWTDSYLLTSDQMEIGYGSIKGQEIADRDTIFEFYLIPPFRKYSSQVFPELIAASGARFIECQSNDLLLTSILYEFAQNINADVVLFEDHTVTEHTIPGVIFRPQKEDDLSLSTKSSRSANMFWSWTGKSSRPAVLCCTTICRLPICIWKLKRFSAEKAWAVLSCRN
jgi:hypothetical protein